MQRLPCPRCGLREMREFHLHSTPNPAATGWVTELWWHRDGCGDWIALERHLTTGRVRSVGSAGAHETTETSGSSEAAQANQGGPR
ncbi:MAG: hypothetical protein ACPGOY_18560 [Rhodospirillaceae bacterium]